LDGLDAAVFDLDAYRPPPEVTDAHETA
jgi:hypothetical protein